MLRYQHVPATLATLLQGQPLQTNTDPMKKTRRHITARYEKLSARSTSTNQKPRSFRSALPLHKPRNLRRDVPSTTHAHCNKMINFQCWPIGIPIPDMWFKFGNLYWIPFSDQLPTHSLPSLSMCGSRTCATSGAFGSHAAVSNNNQVIRKYGTLHSPW